MTNEFLILFEKINTLTEHSQRLRNENIELRTSLLKLSEENRDLNFRIKEAHDRVLMLLDGVSSVKIKENTE
tara:strand:+ start:494 stop:709 length:216 start_codon:yes stop_codon:yes gene_type:complete